MNFIFDFDGTIADSFETLVAVFNKNIRDDKDPLTAKEIQALRGMSSRKAIRHLGIRWWQVPKLILTGLPDFRALVPSLRTFDGLPEALDKLKKRGDRLFIVTSNTHDTVDVFLGKNNLENYFIDIKTGASLFKKAGDIRKLIKEQGLKRKDTVYVGDETRDMTAARKARIKIVSVSWGFNNHAILAKRHPNYLINKPEELLTIRLPK